MKYPLHAHKVSQLPCACCEQEIPVQLHHVREGQGMGQRAGDFLIIPLCPECHTGKHGFHGDRWAINSKKKSEMSMLNDTLVKCYGGEKK